MVNSEDLVRSRRLEMSEMRTLVLTKSSELTDRDLGNKIWCLLLECNDELVAYDNRAIYFYYFDSKATRYKQIYDIESDIIQYAEKGEEFKDKKLKLALQKNSMVRFDEIHKHQIKLDDKLKNYLEMLMK